MFENVGPPRVFPGRGTHMIRNDIKNQANLVGMQRLDELVIIFVIAKVGIQSRIVDRRISV